MSDTNATINPFEADTSGAQAGLYKGIGVTLAVTSGKFKHKIKYQKIVT
jgi:hypothetical protein